MGTLATDSLGWDVKEGDWGLLLNHYLTSPFLLTQMVSTYAHTKTLQPLERKHSVTAQGEQNKRADGLKEKDRDYISLHHQNSWLWGP